MAIQHVFQRNSTKNRIETPRPLGQAKGKRWKTFGKTWPLHRLIAAPTPQGITPSLGALKLLHLLEDPTATDGAIETTGGLSHRTLIAFG
jgi:hypothetical protein